MIGLKPDLIWECKDNICKYKYEYFNKKENLKTNPLKSLIKLMQNNKLDLPPNIPSISTGLFGYMGYEMIQFFENIKLEKDNYLNIY